MRLTEEQSCAGRDSAPSCTMTGPAGWDERTSVLTGLSGWADQLPRPPRGKVAGYATSASLGKNATAANVSCRAAVCSLQASCL